MWITILAYIRSRPFAIVGASLGLVLLSLIIVRDQQTQSRISDVDKKVTNVQIISKSPCATLTTHECALKLAKSLTEQDKKNIIYGIVTVPKSVNQKSWLFDPSGTFRLGGS